MTALCALQRLAQMVAAKDCLPGKVYTEAVIFAGESVWFQLWV